MHWIDWVITIAPVLFVLGMAVYSRKYVRGVADFLAAGRVAGRYVISVGDMSATLSIVTLVALCEAGFQCGMAMGFWNKVVMPVTIFMSLTGYCFYRYRQTKCLSAGQFLEIRYNRSLRIVAAFIRTIADMMVNSIGPAVAAKFFIYFIGLPLSINFFGFNVSTFLLIMVIVLSMAMVVIWSGGRVSLLITDTIQGLFLYPIFIVIVVFVLCRISWWQDVAPVMMDRVKGESFINPMDIGSLRDFNLFALIVTITTLILNRASWVGNDTTGCGRNAHEQKMAGILGAWRNGFAYTMMTLVSLFTITVMLGGRFAGEAKEIRVELSRKVANETIQNEKVRQKVIRDIADIPVVEHRIGVDKPYSRKSNPDVVYLDTVHKNLGDTKEGNAIFQRFRTSYYQMMTPSVLRKNLPVGVAGLFVLLGVMLMLSTDDSRILNISSSIIQDVIMPFKKKPFKPKQHLLWLRIMSVGVCIFFLFASLFFVQMDYIMMFLFICCSLWIGAAGPIMVGGLYTRFGTTTGAFCSLIFGSGASLSGLIIQRNWSDHVYPWLLESGNLKYVNNVFEFVSSVFQPYIVWEMSPVKFPVNSYEILFIAMMLGLGSYIIGSLITYRKPFNLDRMFHRGKYNNGESAENKSPWTWKNVYGKLIGIDEEYSKGDKVIAWGVFGYSVVFQFIITFLIVAIWNFISPWPAKWWATYFFCMIIGVSIIVGTVSTFWFVPGGIIDLRRLFKDLANRVDDPLDDGWVEDHVSLADSKTLNIEEKETKEEGD